MLADINDCYLFFNRELNKLQSGSIGPDEFSQFMNVAQQQYFRLKLGLPELYTIEKREAPQQVQTTQVIDDSMRTFMTTPALQSNASYNGFGSGSIFITPANLAALQPSGYLYTYQNPDGSAGATSQPIDFVSFAELGLRLNNYITAPSNEYPVATWIDGNYVVFPGTIKTLTLAYYRYPVTPVFGYTVSPNDEIVYDPLTSVQLEFPNLDWENITWIAIDYAANKLREEFMKQVSEMRLRSGGG